jgi:hypothetical protein
MSMHNNLFKAVEKALEAARPAGKTPRKKCLMLFENKNCAKKLWATMNDGGKLYTVTLDSRCILHRGDMHLVENMATTMRYGEDLSRQARMYWDGQLTDKPCVESWCVWVRSLTS